MYHCEISKGVMGSMKLYVSCEVRIILFKLSERERERERCNLFLYTTIRGLNSFRGAMAPLMLYVPSPLYEHDCSKKIGFSFTGCAWIGLGWVEDVFSIQSNPSQGSNPTHVNWVGPTGWKYFFKLLLLILN